MRCFLISLALSLALFACEKREEVQPQAPATTTKTFRIGLVAKSSTNPVFQAALAGARARAAELSTRHGVNIVIDWQTPPVEDAQKQADLLTQLSHGGADAIIISCSDAATVTGAIDAAVARGVPVMCFDSDAPRSRRFAFFGVDSVEMGRRVLRELANVLDGQGVVAVLAGNPNAPNLQERVRGVREAAAEFPGVTIKDVYYHAETPEDASNKVIQVNKANPDLTGWAMIGGWPLFADALLTNWDPKIKIVCADALPPQLPYVERGVAQVLVAYPVYEWGYESVDMTFRKVYLHEEVPAVKRPTLVNVTKENLGSWARLHQQQGFTGIPQRYLDLP